MRKEKAESSSESSSSESEAEVVEVSESSDEEKKPQKSGKAKKEKKKEPSRKPRLDGYDEDFRGVPVPPDDDEQEEMSEEEAYGDDWEEAIRAREEISEKKEEEMHAAEEAYVKWMEENMAEIKRSTPVPIKEPLEEFQWPWIRPDATVVCYGKRRTGKTWFIRDMMSRMVKFFPFGMVFSKTAFNGFWQQHIPRDFIYDGLNEAALSGLLEEQQLLVQVKDPHINPYKFIILDDIVGKWSHGHPLLERLFTQGRHYKIFTVITTQYPKLISPALRDNVDYAVIFKQSSNISIQALHEMYFSMMPIAQARLIMNKYTSEHQALIVKNDVPTVAPESIMYRKKAQDPGHFTLGCQEFWSGDEDAYTKEVREIEEKLRDTEDAFTGDKLRDKLGVRPR